MAVSTQAAQALRIMYNGIKCIDNRIDAKLEEQQRAIDEGLGVEEEPGAAREECPYHISPQMLWEAKLKKRTLQKGALVFNQSAKEGIKYLQEARLIPDPAAPADIARFLRFTPGLNKEQIGEYLGKNAEENKQTLFAYVRTFDFQNISLLTALRMFLDTFRLPGEAQQIDRIMETFAQWAYEHTAEHDLLINPDVTYCLCFSIIMLNTDLHNPNMKPERRMQLKDFIKLNKSYGDMNQGRELTEDLLVSVYKSIASEQIFTSSAATNDQLRNEQWVNVMRQTTIPEMQQFIAHSPTFFENCEACNAGMYDRDIFSILWGPQLAAAGALLEIVKEHRLLQFALDNFMVLAHIGAYFNLTTVLDSLVYFLSKFSRITTEYLTEDGENDPIEFVVLLGEKTSAQLSLISLLGIVRKLGNNLGKSWEEVLHALCHLYFLGLFPVSDLVHHQCELMTNSERIDLITMVDGLVEERFSTRKGLLSRLFAWSPEEDDGEKNIQMAPIDPMMWSDLKRRMEVSEPMTLPMRHVAVDEASAKGSYESDDDGYSYSSYSEEESVVDGVVDGEVDNTANDTVDDTANDTVGDAANDTVGDAANDTVDNAANDAANTTIKNTPNNESHNANETHNTSESDSYSDDSDNALQNEASDSEMPKASSYELSVYEAKCIESVLECVDRCRLEQFFSSSMEWSNSTLLTVIDSAIHLSQQPYRRNGDLLPRRTRTAEGGQGAAHLRDCVHVLANLRGGAGDRPLQGEHEARQRGEGRRDRLLPLAGGVLHVSQPGNPVGHRVHVRPPVHVHQLQRRESHPQALLRSDGDHVSHAGDLPGARSAARVRTRHSGDRVRPHHRHHWLLGDGRGASPRVSRRSARDDVSHCPLSHA